VNSLVMFNYWSSVKGGQNARTICSELNKMLGRKACLIAKKQKGGIYFLDLIVTGDEAIKYDIESDFMLNF